MVPTEVWANGAADLIEWLGRKENLSVLSSALGRELRPDERGGNSRADLTCRDVETGVPVLINVYFDRLSSAQIGELLMQAAGLDEVILIWIADRIRNETFTTLDWFNNITTDKISFYGLELEMWQIGDSPVAPTFNVMCRPPEGAKFNNVRPNERTTAIPSVLKPKPLMLEYWSEFNNFLKVRSSSLKLQKPMPLHWVSFQLGSPFFQLVSSVSAKDKTLTVGLVLSGAPAKPAFHILQQAKFPIETEVGSALEWHELPDKKESHIFLRKTDSDPLNREEWPEQFQWLLDKLEAFQRAVAFRLETLLHNEASRERGEASDTHTPIRPNSGSPVSIVSSS